MKKTPLKRKTGLKRKNSKLERKTRLRKKNSGQLDMFNKIWRDTPVDERKCSITGAVLNGYYGTSRYVSLFAHVLNKGYYTKWKLEPGNIRLLHPEVHRLVDQGTEEERKLFENKMGCSFKKWFDLKQKLREQYESGRERPDGSDEEVHRGE